MTLDSVAYFDTHFHIARITFLKVQRVQISRPPIGTQHADLVSHYATGEAVRGSHATGNNRKKGSLRCDLCLVLR